MTEFEHFTVLAGGELVEDHPVPDMRAGPAVVWFNVWSRGSEEGANMLIELCNELGFKLDEKVEMVRTRAREPEGESPFLYDVKLQPCRRDDVDAVMAETVRAMKDD